MKKLLILLAALGGILLFSGCESKGWKTVDGVIVFDTPAREPGQKSVLGLKTAPMETVRVGFIGLGMRGPGAVERFTHLDGVEIKALCDLYPERVDSAQAILVRRGFPEAAPYSGEEGWKQLCERDDIDLVYIATPWLKHVPMAVYAMEHGKHVAVEVPAAQSLEECWQLVNTAEKYQRHCMMLENCVYDFFELTTLNMAQHGLFGEILKPRFQGEREHYYQKNIRYCIENIGDSHHYYIDPAAGKSGDGAENRADYQNERRADKTDGKADARPIAFLRLCFSAFLLSSFSFQALLYQFPPFRPRLCAPALSGCIQKV